MALLLSDKFDRDLGTISSLKNIDGGAVGRFSPGRNFAEVEPLFAKYESHVSRGDGSANEILSSLVDLEPKVIDAGGGVDYYLVAIISDLPKGRTVTLVEKND